MDPVAVLGSALGIRGADDLLTGVLAGASLGVLVLTSLLFGRLWCGRICPLGGLQELLASCGSLPVLSAGRKQAPSPPAGPPVGGLLPASCGSLPVPRGRRKPAPSPPAGPPGGGLLLARRVFLAGAGGVGLGLWARRIAAAGAEAGPLRPPGSVAEDCFTGLCARCGNCVRACPTGILRPDLGSAGLAGLLAPRIRLDGHYCREDCNACTQVCPSGAIRPLDMRHKRRHVIGQARLDKSICLMAQDSGECSACLRCCPADAVRKAFDEKQYTSYPAIDPARCNGCGACEAVCPTRPVKAIRVWKVR
jgi:ferredoxin-type protein NapF